MKPAQVPPGAATIVALAKRGRPRKYADAATKQAQYRERVAAKKQDSERRTIIAQILKQAWRGMFDSKHPKYGPEVKQENRLRLAKLRSDLARVSLSDVKEYLKTVEETHDLRGRLRHERSGEAGRIRGQSEMERLVAARQYDTSLGESSRQDPKLASGFRVRPDGARPDQEETDDPDTVVRTGSAKFTEMPISEKRRERAITRIVDQINTNGDSTCLFCDEVFANKLAAERHLFDMYEQGQTEGRKWGKHMSAVIDMAIKMPAAGDLYTAQPETLGTHHERLIDQEARRRKPANIVTNRFPRTCDP